MTTKIEVLDLITGIRIEAADNNDERYRRSLGAILGPLSDAIDASYGRAWPELPRTAAVSGAVARAYRETQGRFHEAKDFYHSQVMQGAAD